ncbi:pyridoxal-phosphate dependent enzyme, partial [candidate division KSB1 bacterium]|nr:pyridoxal-phosphate dependent enzyme [candidate division KSB1 bacterium]
MKFLTKSDFDIARENAHPHIHRTPVFHSSTLSEMTGAEVYLKAEMFQKAGSYKVRGPLNVLAHMPKETRERGLICSSAGNHAQGVARAARVYGVKATVVMAHGAPEAKINATRSYGAEVVLHGNVWDDAYQHSLKLQKEHNLTYIHPFDDPLLVAGQGGVGYETIEDVPGLDMLIVPIGGGGLILLFVVSFTVKQYKRCPSNKILVIFGKVGADRASQCLHGGGKFVIPLLQSHAFLSLEPQVIEIPLEGALSLNNIRVNVPATFTVGISTDPVQMNNAAERLLHLDDRTIRDQAQDIILGQLRLVIATLSIEEINKDREKFMSLINTNVAEEINKIGLTLINVNIRDITDESGYIEAIGKRAAAEAINRARVDVAQQERDGASGQAKADREREVNVSQQEAGATTGQKEAEQSRRVQVAALEAQSIKGEVESKRDYEIATAQREAETVAAKKQAEQEQRV